MLTEAGPLNHLTLAFQCHLYGHPWLDARGAAVGLNRRSVRRVLFQKRSVQHFVRRKESREPESICCWLECSLVAAIPRHLARSTVENVRPFVDETAHLFSHLLFHQLLCCSQQLGASADEKGST